MKNKLIKNQKLRTPVYFIIYTLLFSCIALIVFRTFFDEGKSFVSTDGYRQHLIAFIYFGKYVRKIVRTLVATHKLIIPAWSFSIGMGGDIFTTLSYYVIGDPLNLLSVFVKPENSHHAYNFLVIFRMYLAGLTFSLFCRYKKVGGFFAVLSGSLIYAYIGYALFNGVTHPFFINPMIYLPLMILGAEMIFDGKRPYLFIISVFISAISNFYFFYMLVLVTVVYVVIKLAYTFDKKDIKKSVTLLMTIGVSSVIGVLLSCVSLIPSMLAVLGDSRNESDLKIGLLFPKGYYLAGLSSFVSNDISMSYNTILGFTAISLICIMLMFLKRKHHTLEKILFIVGSVFMLFPFVAHVFNGFSYVSNRWIWAYAMVVAYIVVSCFNELVKAEIRELVAVFAMLGVYALGCVFIRQSNNTSAFAALAVAGISLLTLLALYPAKSPRFVLCKKGVMLLLVAIAVALNGVNFYADNYNNFTSKFTNEEELGEKYFETLGDYIYKYTNSIDDDSFFRYSVNREPLTYNKSLIDGTRGVSFYWSLQNSSTTQFLDEMEKPEKYLFRYYNMDRRAAINYLLGVKYYHSTNEKQVPYGYEKTEKSNLYATDYSLPLAFTYSDYFTRDEYEKMNAVEKQEALLISAMLEEELEGFDKVTPETTSYTLPYKVTAGENTTFENGVITVTEAEAEINLSFDAPEDCELYLRGSFDDYCSVDNPDSGSVSTTLVFTPYTANGELGKKTYSCLTKYDVKYEGRTQFVAALSYVEDGCRGVKVTFNEPGVYTFNDVEVICQPMGNIAAQTDALKKVDTSDFKIENDRISGSVELEEKQILCFSVPYSKGWSVKVDGEEAELLQADTMLCAVALDEGSHTVEMTYKTPYVRPSLMLSAVGFAGFCAAVLYEEITIKRRRGK